MFVMNNLTINGPKTKENSVYNSYDKTKLKNLEEKEKQTTHNRPKTCLKKTENVIRDYSSAE